MTQSSYLGWHQASFMSVGMILVFGLVAATGFCRPLYDLSFPSSSSLFLINITLCLGYCNLRTTRRYFFHTL